MSDTFDAGSIESRLVLDRSDFVDGLREAKIEGDNFGRQKFVATIGADARGVLDTVASVRAELATLSNVNLNIGVTGSNAQIRAISQSASALDGRNIGLSVNLTGVADASAQLRTLRQQVDKLDGRTINLHVRVDTGTTLPQIAAVRAGLDDLDGSTSRVTASTNSSSRAFGMGGGKLRLLAEAALFAGPALVPLSGALLGVTATALTMGVTVGASLGIFGAAVFGAVGNVNGLNKTLDKAKKALDTQREALNQLKPGTDAYALQLHKVDEAQEAVNKANAAFTPTQRKFADGLTAMKGAWQDFIKATEPDTLAVAFTAVDSVTKALPKMVPLVHAITPEMKLLADSFHGWVTDGGFDRFIKLLISTGVPAFHNLVLAGANVSTVFGNMFRTFAVRVGGMSQSIVRVTGQLAQWSNNGGFQGFIGYLNANSPAVRDFLDALWNALKNISNAFQDLGNPSLRLVTLLLQIVAAMPPWLIDTIVAGLLAYRAAVIGIAIATGAWSAAQAILDVVTSPFLPLYLAMGAVILGVVAAIGALVAGIYYLVKNWSSVQHALVEGWNATWNAIKVATLAVWHSGLEPAFHGMETGLHAVAAAALWFWNVVLKPTFNVISVGARLLIVILGTILFTPFYLAFKLLRIPVMELWTHAFKPVFGWITAGAQLWWRGVQLYFSAVVFGVKLVGATALWLWTHAFRPVFGWIADGAKLWWSGVQLYFNTVILIMKTVGKWATWLWANAFRPAYNSISSGTKSLYQNGIRPPMNAISAGFKEVGRWAVWLWRSGIKPQWDAIKTGTGQLKDSMIDVFDKMKTGIQKIWDGVRGVAAKPINFVIDTVYNGGIVKVWNSIAHAVGLDKMKLGNVGHIKYAQGGAIEGGVAGIDGKQILAMPNEHIWTAEEVKNFGGHRALANFRAGFASTGKARVAPGQNNSHYDLGGAVSGAWDTVTGGAKKVGGAVVQLGSTAISGLDTIVRGAAGAVANPILNRLESAATKGVNALIPSSVPYGGLMGGLVKQPFEWIKSWVKKDDSSHAGAFPGGTVPAGIHKAVITAALKAAGVPPPGTLGQWLTGMNTLITRESGWNASAVNRTDSNAAAGHPSMGLAQTIAGTFNAYVPASLRANGILNPVANVAAAIRYIVSRYGNITNVQQANASKPPMGYKGGGVTIPGIHVAGENGPELIATSGGDRVFTAQDTERMLRGTASASTGGSRSPIRFPDKFTLVVGGREFEAFMDDSTRATLADVFDEADRSR